MSLARRAVALVAVEIGLGPLAFPGLLNLVLWGVRSEVGSYLCLEMFQAVESAFSQGELKHGKGDLR